MDNPSSMALSGEPDVITDMDDIYNWAIHSGYSPLNLQYLAVQPRLQGIPRELAGQFTFRDAFNDLLVTQSGRPQPSVWDILHRKSCESSLPLSVLHWVGSLGRQGLWGSYFALAPSLQYRYDWAPSRNVDISLPQMYFWPPSARFSDDTLITPFLQAFRDQSETRAAVEEDFHRFTSLAGLLPRLVRAFWEPFEEHADTEQDLYNYVTSNRMSGWRDARTEEWIQKMMDKARNDSEARQRYLPRPASVFTTPESPKSADPVNPSADRAGDYTAGQNNAPDVRTTDYEDGSRSVQVTERRSGDGRTETTTTWKHYDASGKLVAERRESSSSSTRTWSGRIPGGEASFSWSWDKDVKTDRGKDEDGGEKEEKEEKKGGKGGWFWQ